MRFFITIAICVTSLTILAADAVKMDYWKPHRKKLIECSWASPDPKYLRKNIETMEKFAPYDGIRIQFDFDVVGEVDDKPFRIRNTIFGKTPWKYAWFKDVVNDLKNTKFKKFTDNFLGTTIRPGNVDWFSDSDWASVCNNFHIAAKIARETNLSGLIFDTEVVEKGKNIWDYREFEGHTQIEFVQKARQRGREFADAIFKEYPDMKLLCFFWFSYEMAGGYRSYASPESASLLIPFINGVYDNLPPAATIIEGHEFDSYAAVSVEDFRNLRNDFQNHMPRFVDKSNLAKYRNQTQLGLATYLDAYLAFEKDNNWYKFSKDFVPALEKNGRIALFRKNLSLALQYSDEYAWTWGESCSWWDNKLWGYKPCKRWEEIVPGAADAVIAAKSPDIFAEKFIAQNKPVNIMKNGDFSEGKSEKAQVCGWEFWLQDKSKGSYELKEKKNGSISNHVLFKGIHCGALSQNVNIDSARQYLVCIKVTVPEKKSLFSVICGIGWYDGAKRIHREYDTVVNILSEGIKDSDGGYRKVFIVTAPENATRFKLDMGIQNQSEDDTVMLNSVEVYKL